MKKNILSFLIFTAFAVSANSQTFTNLKPGVSGYFGDAIEHSELIYYRAGTDAAGIEYWTTNGTPNGTKMVKDINPGTDSGSGSNFIRFNNKVIFSANNGTNGRELWETDGTNAGTIMIKDINPGAPNSNPGPFLYYSKSVMIQDQVLIFSANNVNTGTELYKYTQLFSPLTSLFYWDAVLVKDINTGTGHSSPLDFTVYKGKVYFSATDGTAGSGKGRELWVTDGTEAGTMMLKDINPGTGSSSPSNFTVSNDFLFFTANDGTNGIELWVTDGTTPGTKMVKDINDSADSSPRYLYSFNNKLYFSALELTNKRDLWVSDGTSAGTKKVEGSYISNLFPSFEPNNFTELNGELFFSGFDRAIWKLNSQGKAEFAATVNEQPLGVDVSGKLSDFTVYNGRIYLKGYTVDDGYSLWESDGTAGGTKKIEPPIATNTNPLGGTSFAMKAFSNGLFLNANFDTNGWSTWKVVTNPTFVDRISHKALSIFPNPVADKLNINTDLTVKEIRLVSMSGQTIGTWKNTQSVSLSGISQGAYIVHIDTDQGEAVRKMMKN